MQSLKYYKKLLSVITFYDYTNDDVRQTSLFSSDISTIRLVFRFVKLISAFHLSILAWAFLRIISVRYSVSIYILKCFRPGFASTYINMMEPLCRQLQHENNSRHIKILVEPGEAVSDVLVNSYAPNFTVYLDDRHKFARLIAYLIPKSGLEKKFINTSDKFLPSWRFLPSINYANKENQVPTDLATMGIKKENYVIFVHPSRNYYQKRSMLHDVTYRFFDLSTYNQALTNVIQNNLRVVRVGLDVDDLPATLKALRIIDYTGEIRNETSELWLYENCKFLISVCNGAFWFARRFDRPSIITNTYNLLTSDFSTLYTPMNIRYKETGSLLTFAEMLELKRNYDFLSKDFIKDHHLELVPNSSLTIVNAIEDTFNLLDGRNIPSREEIELMTRYKALLADFNIHIVEQMTLPAISYLKEHQHLL